MLQKHIADVISAINPCFRDFILEAGIKNEIDLTNRQTGEHYVFLFDEKRLTLEGLDKKSDKLLDSRLAGV